MPPIKRPRPTRSASNNGRTGGVAVADVQPDEIASIRASVAAREQAPSSRQQAGQFVNWSRIRDQLGDPYDVERIPLSRLRLMRRDPMLAFGLSFIKTPFARAKWYIDAKDSNGPNAEVAANVDWALRRIYASFVFQWMNTLDFGFQAIAKRYEERQPTGTFIATDPETGEKTEQPLWSQGNIRPIVWKPFIALAPEVVEPMWTGQGDFNGILYNQEGAPAAIGAVQQGDKAEYKIDIYHSLWATHAQQENFGSIFGYPRLGYSFRYWWSYWLRWAIADRAFEKKADPGIVVRHPDGSFVDEFGNEIEYRDYALDMGERLRSGATISLPSEVYMGEMDGKPSGVPLWAVEPLKDLVNFDTFDRSFDYLDVQKLRSLWIPEQAFLEGKGGTSSRNVAKEMGESFVESQAVLASQLTDTLNRWVIPQFLATNFPEFIAGGGQAEIIMQGFADQDVEARNQIIQMIGQQDFGARELMKRVDLDKILDDAGMPLLPFTEQKAREAQIIAEQQAAAGPTAPVEPQPGASAGAGTVGVVPSSTGFSYIQPREVIYLSDNSASFLERLPSSVQYEDSQVRRNARQLWEEWRGMYADEYDSFASFLEEQDTLEFGDVTDDIRKQARRIVKAWETNVDRLGRVLDRTTGIYKSVMDRAAKLEADRSKLDAHPDDNAFDNWVKTHAAEFVSTVSFTTREELTDFIAKRINDGESAKDIAKAVREHFSDFPDWKADRLARTEVREAYNAATLLTAQANGVDAVQALDGTGDPVCKARNGQVFTIDDAFQEREHPNGTLGWRILPVNLSYSYTDEELPGGVRGVYDADSYSVVFADDVTEDERAEYMLAVGKELVR
jgi:SPP1 gp7 family putative phage head morphogenesis protein